MGVSFLSFSLDTYAERGDQGCVRFEGGGVRLAVRVQMRVESVGKEGKMQQSKNFVRGEAMWLFSTTPDFRRGICATPSNNGVAFLKPHSSPSSHERGSSRD